MFQVPRAKCLLIELPFISFPPPKVFTNSLLNSHDITTLIRDTEDHERALFTLAPQDKSAGSFAGYTTRRATSHGFQAQGQQSVNGGDGARSIKVRPTVATLLGGDLGKRLREESTKEGKDRGEVDVDLLLKGAEKLCAV